MSNKNSFFRLLIKEDGIYIKIFAAEPGGQPVLYNEISNYLYEKKVYEYDKLAVLKALKSHEVSCEVKLSSIVIPPQDECLAVEIATDTTYAKGRFYPPSNNGALMTKEDIINKLSSLGIKYGLDEKAVGQFLSERKYCTDYILARGVPAKQGKDAVITYYFNTDLSLKPKRNEDGSVDFHQLGMISHCKRGDLLAVLAPADPGKQGMDVCGRVVSPAKVKRKTLKYGKNIHISEDGLQMYSDLNGHVSLIDSRVFVYDTYEIPANVDNSTGDIEYDGNVIIKGNVLTGFSVKAKGDIEIDGVVEGAYIEAGGQIVLRRGMQGMTKGILKAKGNIIAKFIENAHVISGGYISTESIMHSDITAQEDIAVGGRRGFVTGGRIRSGTSIVIKNAGSGMGTVTVLEVGINPTLLDEAKNLEKKMSEMEENEEKFSKTLLMYRKKIAMGVKFDEQRKRYINQIARGYVGLEKDIKESKERYDAIRLEMESDTEGKIIIQGTVYPGTKLIISGISYYIRDEIKYSKFVRDGADVKVLPL